MAQTKLFVGPTLRRLRRAEGMTQAAMADALDISPTYLNLLEKNQRPLSARLMLSVAERFDIDPRTLTTQEPGGGLAAMRRRLADPRFADLGIEAAEIEEWLAAAPNVAEAFVRLFDQSGPASPATTQTDSVQLVRREIEKWRNYFADIDVAAEELADELRMHNGDLYAAISDRLRSKHQLMIRILPGSVIGDNLRRFDLHARQLQLSEMLDPASRTFHAAYLLGQLEFRDAVDTMARGAEFGNRTAKRLFQRHLFSYFAAALMMPYMRFLRACEATGYDSLVLQRRFGAGFEQVAHRLTTLQRVGARGLPFFMVRVDRGGQFSKLYAGASNAALAQTGSACPLWRVHHVFATPGQIMVQQVEMEDASRWFTLARTVQGSGFGAVGSAPEFAIGLGVAAEHAAQLCYASGMDLSDSQTSRIGLGCALCTRPDCAQRSAPPANRTLRFDERVRGISAFEFAGD